jgi:hypothetical protein
MIEKQTRASMGDYVKDFQVLKFTTTGSVPSNPVNLDEATGRPENMSAMSFFLT